MLSFFFATLIYILKFIEIDVEMTLYAILQIIPTLSLLHMILVVFLSRRKISAIFTSLSTIYRASKKFR